MWSWVLKLFTWRNDGRISLCLFPSLFFLDSAPCQHNRSFLPNQLTCHGQILPLKPTTNRWHENTTSADKDLTSKSKKKKGISFECASCSSDTEQCWLHPFSFVKEMNNSGYITSDGADVVADLTFVDLWTRRLWFYPGQFRTLMPLRSTWDWIGKELEKWRFASWCYGCEVGGGRVRVG